MRGPSFVSKKDKQAPSVVPLSAVSPTGPIGVLFASSIFGGGVRVSVGAAGVGAGNYAAAAGRSSRCARALRARACVCRRPISVGIRAGCERDGTDRRSSQGRGSCKRHTRARTRTHMHAHIGDWAGLGREDARAHLAAVSGVHTRTQTRTRARRTRTQNARTHTHTHTHTRFDARDYLKGAYHREKPKDVGLSRVYQTKANAKNQAAALQRDPRQHCTPRCSGAHHRRGSTSCSTSSARPRPSTQSSCSSASCRLSPDTCTRRQRVATPYNCCTAPAKSPVCVVRVLANAT